MKNFIQKFLFVAVIPFAVASAQPATKYNLQFNHLATRWDEAMFLGNGMMGALIWQKDSMLRLSLDRADLWDERKALDLSKFNFKWVTRHVLSNDYDTVHKLGDEPYDTLFIQPNCQRLQFSSALVLLEM
jgi:alpha-L-fucosidase 2